MRHYLRWNLVAMVVGLSAGLLLLLRSPEPCYGCSSPPPPVACHNNLSAMTVRQQDERNVWWDWFDDREEQTLNLYMGMNYVNGSEPFTATYAIAASDPFVDARLEPREITFDLQPARSAGANDTQIIQVPYGGITNTQQVDITATLVDTNEACPTLQENSTTTVKLNPTGPTVWPIVPRSCPMPGEEPELAFGIRNPSNSEQTYDVVAYSQNTDPYNGSDSDLFSLNGQGGTANLEPVTLKPGETTQVTITCETFGYCQAGGENRVGVEVSPTANSEQFEVADAWSNVTLRDQSAECPVVNDWWFLPPPWLLPLLIGVPLALLLLLGGGGYTLYRMRGFTPATGGSEPQQPRKKPKERLYDNQAGSVSKNSERGKGSDGSSGVSKK